MYNLHKKVSSETLIADKFTTIPLCHVCCCLPTHLGPLAVVFLFWGNHITCTPLTNFLSYVLTGFEGEQRSPVRFMEWWTFSVLNGSLLSSNINYRLWNTGAVTQESLQTMNSSLGKLSVSFGVKEKWKYCSFFRGMCICFVYKWGYEMLKLLHNHM